MKQTNTMETYQEHTDKYFLRSKQILEAEHINPIVRYQVFARQDIPQLRGITEATEFIRNTIGNKARIYTLQDGQSYTAKEPIMKIEGRVQDIIDLETIYLSTLSGRLTGNIPLEEMRNKAKEIINAAKDKPVYYYGARHYAPELDEDIAKICQEEGFKGCSTDIGAKAWNTQGVGTTPHALILAYAAHIHEQGIYKNPTIEAAKAFDKNIDATIQRIILIDTFNKEVEDTIALAREIPHIAGIRIDTCGENTSQHSTRIQLPELPCNPKYIRGKGVTIAGTWALRRAMDKEDLWNSKIIVSSGFNEEKTKAFIEADTQYQKMYKKPLFDIIGTGSIAKPIMTTSDIVAYYNEQQKQWIPMSKKGRGEIPTTRLEERI